MAINVAAQHAQASGQNTGTSVVKGSRAGELIGPSKQKEEEDSYQKEYPQYSGVGKAGWRSSPEGKAHRDAWQKKKMTPPPSGPKLTDMKK